MSSQQRRPREPWQNNERHYCAVCNAWMGSDRQSILLHENGRKHRENVERALQEKRIQKQKEEKAQKFLNDSLRQMEQAALGSHVTNTNKNFNERYDNHNDVSKRKNPPQSSVGKPKLFNSAQYPNGQILYQQQYQHAVHQKTPTSHFPFSETNNPEIQPEKIDWQATIPKHNETNGIKRKDREHNVYLDNGNEDEGASKRLKTTIAPGEGYYSYENDSALTRNEGGQQESSSQKYQDETIANGASSSLSANDKKAHITYYLEGEVFHGLLEDDLPIQIWTGSLTSSNAEKRDSKNIGKWKNALVMAIRRRSVGTSVHVSYLASLESTEETIEKNVSFDRIRIILGSDERIPDSLEEARLLAMGGEEIHVGGTGEMATSNGTNNTSQNEINEATGLSGWSTVTIKKTTHRQQHREERERFALLKQEAAKKQEEERKRVIERKLEEARVSNADDSALGAYDVWGKMDYKGVDISKEVNCSVEDTAKRLARTSQSIIGRGTGDSGPKVAFKRRVKKKGQKAARRRTSADDD